MSLSHYQSTAVDEAGNVLSGATVTVRREADGSLASIKSDRGGASAKANPFTTDADGAFDFYAVGGAYKITVVSGSLTRTYRYVALGTAAELDASDLAGLHGLLYERLTSTSAASITSGKFSGNNADLALATVLYFSTTDANGNDQYARLLAFGDSTSAIKGVLSLSLTSGDTISFAVTAATDLTDSSPAYDVVSLAVTLLSGADAQIAGDLVYCDFYATGDKGDQGIQGIQGIQGDTGASAGLRWVFSDATADADPGSGQFRLNNSTHASATAIYIDNNDYFGSDVSSWLDTLDDSGNSTLRGYLFIMQGSDPSVFLTYAVSGSVVDGTGYRKLTVAFVDGGFALTDASPGVICSLVFSPRGPAGTGDVTSTNNLSDISSPKTGFDNISVHGADVPSAGTIDLDAAGGVLIDVTGTVTITAITLSNGRERVVRFTGALTLTHGASLVLPGAQSIMTAAGDYAIFRGYAAGVVRCVMYARADSHPLIAGLQTIASGTTTDLGSVREQSVTVSGTTTITSFGSSAPTGALKTVHFSGALTLTHNGTSLILPGAANITTVAGDCTVVRHSGSGNWRVISYLRAAGRPVNTGQSDTLAKGFDGTSYAGGTITGSNQTYTPSVANGNGQHITLNGSSLTGTFTFAVPTLGSGDWTQVITEVVNGGSGSVGATLSASGYTKAETAAYNTTNGNKFLFNAIRSKNYSYLQVVPLQ